MNIQNSQKIAIYSQFRSGSNYLKALLELNSNATVMTQVDSFWKHGYFVELKTINSYIFIVKNPYSFLYSLYNYYMNNGRNKHLQVFPVF